MRKADLDSSPLGRLPPPSALRVKLLGTLVPGARAFSALHHHDMTITIITVITVITITIIIAIMISP